MGRGKWGVSWGRLGWGSPRRCLPGVTERGVVGLVRRCRCRFPEEGWGGGDSGQLTPYPR